MHTCLYVLITGPDTQTDTLVAQALAPFDQGRSVPPWKLYLAASGIRAMAEHYGLKESDLAALARRLPEWMECDGGVDDLGLYATMTHNPDGKFDWYEIGGRWNGRITGRPRRRRSKTPCALEGNCIASAELLAAPDFAERLPHAVLTPTGEWVERTTYVSTGNGWYTRDESTDEWSKRVRRMLSAFPAHRVVCVDTHV